MITLFQAKRKLARSIRNERRNYDQKRYVVSGVPQNVPATCGTACCIAGHIEACWPGTARRLMAENDYGTDCGCIECSRNPRIDHAQLARDIWQAVTGKPCRFDFSSGPGFAPDREDAVAHIYGRHKEWPLEGVERA